MTAPALSLDGIRTYFRTAQGIVRAVEDVSLAVAERSTLGVVGESGSGKTQSLLSVLGLSTGEPGVIAGRASIGGRDLLGGLAEAVRERRDADGRLVEVTVDERWRRAHLRRVRAELGNSVALLSQDPKRSLVPYLRVRDHLRPVLRRHHEAADVDAAAADALTALGFRDPRRVLSSFPDQLSGGECQRVMLALAAAVRPQLLVADEPTTALDALSQARVLEELRRLRDARPFALVLISHDIGLVSHLTDAIAVIFGGRVVERLSTRALDDAAAESLHPYTAALITGQRRRQAGRAVLPVSHADTADARPEVGCAYAVRCPLRPTLDPATRLQCTRETPVLRRRSDAHETACWGMDA
jgi:ABC-type dipeptide/oligopeptide/nickel transport system ATPase component